MNTADFGRSLDSSIIERGLRELCPDIHFDLAAATGQIHPFIFDRQGVYYMGRHICSLDRGMVPEFKVWEIKTTLVPIEWADADKEDARIQFTEIPKFHPEYEDLKLKAEKGLDNSLALHDNGKLMRYVPMGVRKHRGRVIRCGWRHTFERLIAAGLPGITRRSVAAKFGVDMNILPSGSPEEIEAAIGVEV